MQKYAACCLANLQGMSGSFCLIVQGEIGIRNKRHCTDIVKHLAELETPPNNPEEADRRRRNKVTLCVEGNISAGKSSFLQKLLKTSVELRDIIEVSPDKIEHGHHEQACGIFAELLLTQRSGILLSRNMHARLSLEAKNCQRSGIL